MCSRNSKASSNSAAFSIPNEYGVGEVCAAVVSKEKLDEQSLRAHCEERIPRPFAPARYYFVDSLPHNEMGKIDRRRLQELVNQAAGRLP